MAEVWDQWGAAEGSSSQNYAEDSRFAAAEAPPENENPLNNEETDYHQEESQKHFPDPWTPENNHSVIDPEELVDVRTSTKSFHAETSFQTGCAIFCFFCCYVILFFVILQQHICIECANDFARALDEQFINQEFQDPEVNDWIFMLKDVDTHQRMWEWAREVWASEMLAARLESGEEVDPEAARPVSANTEWFLGENKVAQLPSITQGRVPKRTCEEDLILHTKRKCLVHEDTFNSDWTLDGLGTFTAIDKVKYVVRVWLAGDEVPNDTDEVIVKPQSLGELKDELTKLEDGDWVDRETSWISFQTVFWNPNLDILILMRIVFVQPVVGQFQPFMPPRSYKGWTHHGSTFRVGRINHYSDGADYVRLCMEVLFLLMTFLITAGELWQLISAHRYGGTIWIHFYPSSPAGRENIFDASVLLLTYAAVFTYFMGFFEEVTKEGKMLVRDDYNDSWGHAFYVLNTVLCVLFTFQVLKYARFNSRWKFLTTTLARALPELGNFITILLIILMGYSLAGHYYWGTNLVPFKTLWRSMQTFLQTAIADPRVRYNETVAPEADTSHAVIPVIIYWTFIFIVYFILINMFLAIVLRNYEATMEQLHETNLVTRSLSKRMSEPYQKHVLTGYQKLKWVDKARVDIPVGTGCNYLYSRRCLRIRLRIEPGAYGKLLKAPLVFVALPTPWKAMRVAKEGEWHVSVNKHRQRHRITPELVHPGLIQFRNNFHNEFDPLGKGKTVTTTVVIPLLLSAPDIQHRLQGPVLPCLTTHKNFALGLGDSFESVPYVVRRHEVTFAELHQIPQVHEGREPKPGWEDILEYTALMFQPEEESDDKVIDKEAAGIAKITAKADEW